MFKYYQFQLQHSEHVMSLFPYPYFDFEKNVYPYLFRTQKLKSFTYPYFGCFEIIPNILRIRTLMSTFLRTRNVYVFRTLVRVHKHYGFRPRRSESVKGLILVVFSAVKVDKLTHF